MRATGAAEVSTFLLAVALMSAVLTAMYFALCPSKRK